jgi:hypothetical protein
MIILKNYVNKTVRDRDIQIDPWGFCNNRSQRLTSNPSIARRTPEETSSLYHCKIQKNTTANEAL